MKRPFHYLAFNNTLASKTRIADLMFEESLTNYGHEDTLLAYQLMKKGCPVVHIENPVLHEDVEENEVFLKKSEEAIENLQQLVSAHHIEASFARISKWHQTLERMRMTRIFSFMYAKWGHLMRRHLVSNHPSLKVFNLYKLCYFCYLDRKK